MRGTGETTPFDGWWKVCGLTRPGDIRLAREVGVDWFGVIGYAGSPRAVDPAGWPELLAAIPTGRAVYVDVLPEVERLRMARDAGFARMQIHFGVDDDSCRKVAALVRDLGGEGCWLAPKLASAGDFDPSLADLGETFLLDGIAPGKFGGTGEKFDPAVFRQIAATFPHKKFILAGGLAPANIGEMLKESGARAVDVNSGVEIAPGLKSAEKLRAVAGVLGRVRPHPADNHRTGACDE